MADTFRRFLELAATAPDTPVSLLPLIGDAEARALAQATAGARSDAVEEGAAAGTEADARTGVLAALAATVGSAPDATAVVAGDRSLSFTGLAASAARTAGGLAAAGVGRGDVVSVMLSRSLDTVAALGRAEGRSGLQPDGHRLPS